MVVDVVGISVLYVQLISTLYVRSSAGAEALSHSLSCSFSKTHDAAMMVITALVLMMIVTAAADDLMFSRRIHKTQWDPNPVLLYKYFPSDLAPVYIYVRDGTVQRLTVVGTGIAEKRFLNCKPVNRPFVSFSDTKSVTVQQFTLRGCFFNRYFFLY